MTINGTYTQNADGNLFINILNLGNFSNLQVQGAAGTAGVDGTVTVGLISGGHINLSDTYNIVNTTGGVAGTL